MAAEYFENRAQVVWTTLMQVAMLFWSLAVKNSDFHCGNQHC